MRRLYLFAVTSLIAVSAIGQTRKATAPVNGPQRKVSIEQPKLQNTPSTNVVQKSKNKPVAYPINPAAKSMIEISRTQDEEVGDGTTSVIVLAGETLSVAEQFLQQQMHPTVIISAYRQALEEASKLLKDKVR